MFYERDRFGMPDKTIAPPKLSERLKDFRDLAITGSLFLGMSAIMAPIYIAVLIDRVFNPDKSKSKG